MRARARELRLMDAVGQEEEEAGIGIGTKGKCMEILLKRGSGGIEQKSVMCALLVFTRGANDWADWSGWCSF